MRAHGPGCLQGPLSWGQHWHTALPVSSQGDTPPPPQPGEQPKKQTLTRQDLVERVRREIEAGTYDTPEKFEAALEKMLKRLELE